MSYLLMQRGARTHKVVWSNESLGIYVKLVFDRLSTKEGSREEMSRRSGEAGSICQPLRNDEL